MGKGWHSGRLIDVNQGGEDLPLLCHFSLVFLSCDNGLGELLHHLYFDVSAYSGCLVGASEDSRLLKDERDKLAGRPTSLTTSCLEELATRNRSHKLEVDRMAYKIGALRGRVTNIKKYRKNKGGRTRKHLVLLRAD